MISLSLSLSLLLVDRSFRSSPPCITRGKKNLALQLAMVGMLSLQKGPGRCELRRQGDDDDDDDDGELDDGAGEENEEEEETRKKRTRPPTVVLLESDQEDEETQTMQRRHRPRAHNRRLLATGLSPTHPLLPCAHVCALMQPPYNMSTLVCSRRRRRGGGGGGGERERRPGPPESHAQPFPIPYSQLATATSTVQSA